MRRTLLLPALAAVALASGVITRPPAAQPLAPPNPPGPLQSVAPAPQPAEDEYRLAYQLYAATRPDYARALESARRAAQAGNLSAAFLLGVMYEKGAGVEANLPEARKWFERAASAGDPAALFNLGMVTLAQHDPGAAATAFRAAAEKGLARAQAAYGQALDAGQGLDRDEKEAVKWYRMAAEGGDPAGAYYYGVALVRGEGDIEKNPEEGARWFRTAAEQNIGLAQLGLGMLHTEGVGVAKDEVAATGWYKKASDNGVSEGIYQYAIALSRGLGTAKNAPEAFKLYRRLAEWAHPGGMHDLAALYFNGEGTPPNPQLAYYWAALSVRYYPADDQRRAAAAEFKATVEKNLSMGERINLDVRGATFNPKPAPPLLIRLAPLSPPAPVLQSSSAAPRVEAVRGASGTLVPAPRSGAPLPQRGADEAGTDPLNPDDIPVTKVGSPTFSDLPSSDEGGVAPLDPSDLPVQAPARRAVPDVPDDYSNFD